MPVLQNCRRGPRSCRPPPRHIWYGYAVASGQLEPQHVRHVVLVGELILKQADRGFSEDNSPEEWKPGALARGAKQTAEALCWLARGRV